jgi:hypothetical protein
MGNAGKEWSTAATVKAQKSRSGHTLKFLRMKKKSTGNARYISTS